MADNQKILCLGEALIDVVQRDGSESEHVGGSLLNVACGLAVLGADTSIATWWGKDERGAALEEWASRSGVRIVPGSDGAERTSVAHATIDEQGRANYQFDLEWRVPELTILAQINHLHTGSIAATLEPGGSQVVGAVAAVAGNCTVSYDPNVRPALMGSPPEVLGRIEDLVSRSDLVKVSDEDIEWLYPGKDIDWVMRKWIAMGPELLVLTRGPRAAHAYLASNRDMLAVTACVVEVGDTVGAGDSFMAGLISGLTAAGLLGGTGAREKLRGAGWSDVQPALHRAVVASALTVAQTGAYSPTMDEVAELTSRPGAHFTT